MVFPVGSLFNFANSTGSLLGTLSNLNPTNLIRGTLGNVNNNGVTVGAATGIQQSSGMTGQSFSFEQVAATLRPFQFPQNLLAGGSNHPMAPILSTGGVVFPYNPSISEGVGVAYDQTSVTHSNESYYSYRNTDNVRINISDAVWTCDTFSNAVYALAVLHFFRSYSLMDFGKFKTGRPPSPMWFTAYGNYAFNNVPVLFEKADWNFPNDIDFVGVPEPGSPEYQQGRLQTNRNATGTYTWLPVEFTISSISLIVQHSPQYWLNFSLEDYYSGAMLQRGNRTFHQTNPDGNTSLYNSNSNVQ